MGEGSSCASAYEDPLKNEGAGMRRWRILRNHCYSFAITHA